MVPMVLEPPLPLPKPLLLPSKLSWPLSKQISILLKQLLMPLLTPAQKSTKQHRRSLTKRPEDSMSSTRMLSNSRPRLTEPALSKQDSLRETPSKKIWLQSLLKDNSSRILSTTTKRSSISLSFLTVSLINQMRETPTSLRPSSKRRRRSGDNSTLSKENLLLLTHTLPILTIKSSPWSRDSPRKTRLP